MERIMEFIIVSFMLLIGLSIVIAILINGFHIYSLRLSTGSSIAPTIFLTSLGAIGMVLMIIKGIKEVL